jgi:hypothetical protein
MKPTELAQWVINNRYPKSENDKVSDSEMYNFIVENTPNNPFSYNDLKSLWNFISAQRLIVVHKHNSTNNHIEKLSLAITANTLADIMDEITQMLEKAK